MYSLYNMDYSSRSVRPFQRSLQDFNELKKEVDKEVIIRQEIERRNLNNTYRVLVNSRIGTSRQAGTPHNNFEFTLPPLPTNGEKRAPDCAVRIRGIFLPKDTSQGVTNVIKVYTDFLKPNQFQTRDNRQQSQQGGAGFSADLLGVCSIQQKVYDLVLNNGAIGPETYLRMRMDGKIDEGNAASTANPYYALCSDGSLLAESSPDVALANPFEPTDAATGEIVKTNATVRYTKCLADGSIPFAAEGTDPFPGVPYEKLRTDGSITPSSDAALATTIGFIPTVQNVLPRVHNLIPKHHAFQFNKKVKGYEGKPLVDDWIPCRNPFGERIRISLRKPSSTAGGETEDLVATGSSNSQQVLIELEIRTFPDYRSM